jgi:hypothetical protein
MLTFVAEQKLRQLDAADFPIDPQVEIRPFTKMSPTEK